MATILTILGLIYMHHIALMHHNFIESPTYKSFLAHLYEYFCVLHKEERNIPVSPIREALCYKRLLNEPQINSYAEIANDFGVSRARVCQMMNLLKLSPEIQQELLNLTDQKKIRYL